MESRDDKMVALVGLLAAALIGVTILFTVTWFSGLRHNAEPLIDNQTCLQPTANSHSLPPFP
ncbi:hypothetical protein CIG19_00270 [Enterobacterales bacterium CwR94]|nr:hypothetical protein CIG19_00270 [Enterobacterales bacterium CwR94]